jgi:VIT1/CCC1 family predicted Fe2+/Mn2+ transporter
MQKSRREPHSTDKIGWLRAAVLGANDGIVSTASLIIGVASAHATHQSIVLTALAGLVAGAMSMATGEYVSVSSQLDTERAALSEERAELDADFPGELRELGAIYVRRGLPPSLAREVAAKLMEHDALAAHARDELGISSATTARPLQAALASAASFSVGAALPLLVVIFVFGAWLTSAVAAVSLISLGCLGALAAKTGGAGIVAGATRVLGWSALAMLVTAIIGRLFGSPGV